MSQPERPWGWWREVRTGYITVERGDWPPPEPDDVVWHPLYSSPGGRPAHHVNLRNYARGHQCTVRLPTVCTFSAETVVLAHFRLSGISGLGLKPPDLLAAWCCSACHRVVDTSKDPEVQLAFAHGVLRTQAALIAADVVRW